MKFRSLLIRLSSSSTAQHPRRAIAVFVTNSQSSSFSTTTTSSASGSSLSSSRRHHHEEDSRSVRVAVWWDFDKCNLPASANVFKLAQSITGAIRNSGIKGPITITAFGDVLNLSRSNQEALSSTGITLTHVPQGGKNSADRSLITDLMCWVSQNPPPAHVFLISTDEAFASVLHRLRMSNYNVLLSSKSSAPNVLCSAASIMWDWEGLIKGDCVNAKYFNQPPDGPYNSWYGHYRVPLLDPFATTSTEEVSESSSSSVKARFVPKEVVDKIRMVLSLYPKGVSVSELRAELIKSNVGIDKEFYGHKSFARFLQSMPDVFQVNRASDGLFVVRAVTEKVIPKRVDSSPGLATAVDEKIKEKVSASGSTSKLMTDVELGCERKGRDISLGKKQENVTENDKHVKEKARESSQESNLVSQKDGKPNDKPVKTKKVSLIAGSEDSIEDGFVQKLKRLWSGSPEMVSEHLPENKSASGRGDKDEGIVNDGKAEDKDLKSSSQGTDSVSQISPSFAGESSAEDVKTGTDEDKNASPGFFSQLLKSFKFWGGVRNDSSGTQKLVQVHDIFANESSWDDVESFINSPRGYVIVSHSRTREMIAKNLQREGPSCLKQLDESSMLHLVTLLISHKKWIEENPSSSIPFSITKSSSPSHGHASNGLSLIFSDCAKSEDGEKKFKNAAHAGVSVGYKSNAIADCQKLIKKVTEKSPEGYSLIRFRKDFLEEYGYHLDVEKLGYKNLQSLIQVMPGVRISSGYILPSPSGKSTKEDESDSSFEELGPVSEATSTMTRKVPVYEPSLSEDEDSGSERDIPKKKQVMSENDKDSSLLQILDSYYKSNGEAKMEQPVERKIANNVRKPKPSKTYSFVKDAEVQ